MSKPLLRSREAHKFAEPGGAAMPAGGEAGGRALFALHLTPLFWRQAKTDLGRRTLKVVWVVLALQLVLGAAASTQGIADLIAGHGRGSAMMHLGIGGLLILMVGAAIGATNLLVREIQRSDGARAIAVGAFAPLVQQRLFEWALTPAERDVAMFTLKGFETHEIAEMRHTSQGTVRVQLARVYEKAGVNSRCAFQSMFFEDLLDAEPQDARTPPPGGVPQGASRARVVSRREAEGGSGMLPV